MEVSREAIRNITGRILKARMKLLHNNPFYGLLLMYLKISISDEHSTAWTDGERIYFNPEFIEKIDDKELEYVLAHELLHIVLKHLERMDKFNDTANEAADIIVNSNILKANGFNDKSISLKEYGGTQPHLAPDGTEGWTHSLEELYLMLLVEMNSDKGDDDSEDEESDEKSEAGESDSDGESDGDSEGNGKGWDCHCGNGGANESSESKEDIKARAEEWKLRIYQAAKQVKEIHETQKYIGSLPGCVERYLQNIQEPSIDWRTILEEFIQEEINDYSFCPPDRRFDESPFFLPDFNERDDRVEKILFMIDTSGSMSDDEVRDCYSEIKGAIDQFNGKIEGWLGFFDAAVVPPTLFVDEDEFKAIHPEGGGGTAFDIIFDYVDKEMEDDPPVSIVILTDGYAPFPDIECTKGIPTLWIINNEEVDPPWGKVARIPNNNNIDSSNMFSFSMNF